MTEWILPTNPNTFRTDDAFRALGKLEWHQSKNIKIFQEGIVIYIYKCYSINVKATEARRKEK